MTESNHYVHDDTWDVIRFQLPKLPSQDEDPSDFLLEMPYSIFLTRFQRQQIIDLIQRKINVSDFRSLRIDRMFGIAFNYVIYWTEPNEKLYFAFFQQTVGRPWLIFKWTYRCCLSIYIMIFMWQQYYRHYHHLALNVQLYGIEDARPTDCIEIVIGDPTSIILLNPLVSILFILDVWVSIDFVTRAMFRIDQLQDMKICLIACLYLSRMLWMAYGSLIMISYILKKVRKEKSFREADPTLTALVVMASAGPLTHLLCRILVFIELYYCLFKTLSKDEHSIEATFSVIVYGLTIGMLPVLFGFLPKCPVKMRQHNPMADLVGSFTMNDFKHRLTHYFNFMTLTAPEVVKGGSIYQLFKQDRKFKRCLGMSQRGGDCYLIYGGGKRHTSVRLSLLSCLDSAHFDSTSTASTSSVGRISFEKNGIQLIHGAYNSPWVA